LGVNQLLSQLSYVRIKNIRRLHRKKQIKIGASDGDRTHNLLHGKQMLYQLSYTRVGSEGGTRTLTAFEGQRILSPWCLPIPPLRPTL
tara:strand:- start:408 stop:671 length:264 start_codon:yes stop_codon:yes gene_type:complete